MACLWENATTEISALVSSGFKAIVKFSFLLCCKGIPVKDPGLGLKLQGFFNHAGDTKWISSCFSFLLLCRRVLWKKSRSPLFVPAIKVHLGWELCYHTGFLKYNFNTICIFDFAIYLTYLHNTLHYNPIYITSSVTYLYLVGRDANGARQVESSILQCPGGITWRRAGGWGRLLQMGLFLSFSFCTLA